MEKLVCRIELSKINQIMPEQVRAIKIHFSPTKLSESYIIKGIKKIPSESE
jgi:hypothetical protein